MNNIVKIERTKKRLNWKEEEAVLSTKKERKNKDQARKDARKNDNESKWGSDDE